MTEQDILALHRSGKTRQAFELIIKLYGERLYWHARRMVISHEDANDCLQNALIKVWKALPGFRGDSALFTWLYRILTNECLSFIKKEQLRSTLDFEAAWRIEAEKDINGKEIQKSLHKAIAKLPPKQKAVFLLRYFEEMPYNQMSEVLETSEGALKASYHHAYEKVKAWIEEDIEL